MPCLAASSLIRIKTRPQFPCSMSLVSTPASASQARPAASFFCSTAMPSVWGMPQHTATQVAPSADEGARSKMNERRAIEPYHHRAQVRASPIKLGWHVSPLRREGFTRNEATRGPRATGASLHPHQRGIAVKHGKDALHGVRGRRDRRQRRRCRSERQSCTTSHGHPDDTAVRVEALRGRHRLHSCAAARQSRGPRELAGDGEGGRGKGGRHRPFGVLPNTRW